MRCLHEMAGLRVAPGSTDRAIAQLHADADAVYELSTAVSTLEGGHAPLSAAAVELLRALAGAGETTPTATAMATLRERAAVGAALVARMQDQPDAKLLRAYQNAVIVLT